MVVKEYYFKISKQLLFQWGDWSTRILSLDWIIQYDRFPLEMVLKLHSEFPDSWDCLDNYFARAPHVSLTEKDH